MIRIEAILEWMQQLAPLELSEQWDNTGLLLGDRLAELKRIQTCLTLTPETVAEAVERQASLVIAHHPLPFRPLSRITTDTVPGKMLWKLAEHGIAVYSPHTAWDSAERGINAQLASKLELGNCKPLVPSTLPELSTSLGAGRQGTLSQPLDLQSMAQHLQELLPGCRPRGVDSGRSVRQVAIACGSGGSLLSAAVANGCELFLTGEATFHTCLEAQAEGIALLMVGHFASEKFAMDQLAMDLRDAFGLEIWSSEQERDPVANL